MIHYGYHRLLVVECYNLDFNTMDNNEIKKLYGDKSKYSNINIVEGNKDLLIRWSEFRWFRQ